MTTANQASQRHPIRVYTVVYFVLWVIGLAGTWNSVTALENDRKLGFSEGFSKWLAITSLVILTLIYYDLDRIDKLQSGDRDYPGFVGVKLRDPVLRSLIMICLLFAVGELHAVQDLLWRGICNSSFVSMASTVPGYFSFVSFLSRSDVFPSGSCCAFALMAAWNLCALYYRHRDYYVRIGSFTQVSEIVDEWVVQVRVFLFSTIASICALFWGFVWWRPELVTSVASLFLITYSLIGLVVAILLTPVTKRWIARLLLRLYEEARVIEIGFVSNPATLQVEARKQWLNTVDAIYNKMRERSVDGSYTIDCNHVAVQVCPNVYAPRYFTDSLWFARKLPKIVKRRSLLEIGTGTGIIAMACALRGARVVATDVNPDAIKNATLNIDASGLKIEVRLGNVYAPLQLDESFDFIFWAHPFNNCPAPVYDMLLRSGMDHQYEAVKEYVANARKHLTSNGRLLLGTGVSADVRTLAAVAAQCGYRLQVLRKGRLPLEEGGTLTTVYLLCECVPL